VTSSAQANTALACLDDIQAVAVGMGRATIFDSSARPAWREYLVGSPGMSRG